MESEPKDSINPYVKYKPLMIEEDSDIKYLYGIYATKQNENELENEIDISNGIVFDGYTIVSKISFIFIFLIYLTLPLLLQINLIYYFLIYFIKIKGSWNIYS